MSVYSMAVQIIMFYKNIIFLIDDYEIMRAQFVVFTLSIFL
jgi:hypothetical protein